MLRIILVSEVRTVDTYVFFYIFIRIGVCACGISSNIKYSIAVGYGYYCNSVTLPNSRC